MKILYALLTASTLSISLAAPAGAAGLMDSIKSQAESLGGGGAASQSASGLGNLGGSAGSGLGNLGGAAGIGSALGLPSVSSGTADNAAGVLQYCIQNKYLGGSDAASVKDQLLSKAGMGSQTKPEAGCRLPARVERRAVGRQRILLRPGQDQERREGKGMQLRAGKRLLAFMTVTPCQP
ncbi:hypothetical protein CDEF62S_05690 [Castellaniella defragrans]